MRVSAGECRRECVRECVHERERVSERVCECEWREREINVPSVSQ